MSELFSDSIASSEDHAGSGGVVRDPQACLGEYAFIREEMIENIKKQDKCFFTIYASFGILAYLIEFDRPLMTVFLCLVVLLLVIVLQSKIIEYRNVVYYTSSYLVILERTCVQYRWDRRFSKFHRACADRLEKSNQGFMRRSRIVLLRVISAVKHFVNSMIATTIVVIVVYVSASSVTSGSIDSALCYAAIAAALVLEAVSIAMTVFVVRDRSTKGDYCQVWEEIISSEE